MESEEFDYYEVLGVAIESTAKDISKAYRQKALKYHPDKNPDNAELIKLFHQIKKAHEILTNPQERAAYDEKRKAKVQQIRKRQQMGQARQKMKDELEANERLAKQRQQEAREAKWRAEMEAEKFRAEAARAEQRREAMMQREIKRQMKAAADAAQEQMQHEESDELERSVRVRWDRSRVYMKDELERIFKQFGELEEVVVVASSARTTTTSSSSSALMVYSTVSGALQLMNAAESGTHPELSPFSCRWVTGDRVSAHHKQQPLASSSSSVHATQELSTEDITSMRQKASTPTLAVPPTSRDSAAEIPIPTVSMLSRYLSSSQLSLPFHELEAGILAQMRDIQSGNL